MSSFFSLHEFGAFRLTRIAIENCDVKGEFFSNTAQKKGEGPNLRKLFNRFVNAAVKEKRKSRKIDASIFLDDYRTANAKYDFNLANENFRRSALPKDIALMDKRASSLLLFFAVESLKSYESLINYRQTIRSQEATDAVDFIKLIDYVKDIEFDLSKADNVVHRGWLEEKIGELRNSEKPWPQRR